MISPLVSVIIPCYNGEQFVRDAIESALGQTYGQREVIVVDDGSSDASLEVIRSFGDAIRWASGPNRGGSAARNTGLSLTRGEYVQFLDADDILMPECVARKVHAAHAMPGVCHCCDWLREGSDARSTTERPSAEGDDPVVAVLSGQNAICSPLHQRSNLDAVGGFDESLPCSQERDLHLRLACAGVRFARLAETLLVVRRQEQSVSADYTRVLLHHFLIFTRAASRLAMEGRLTASRRFAFARALSADGRALYRRGRTAEARQYWNAARGLDRNGLHAAYGRGTRALSRTMGPEGAEVVASIARLGFVS